MTRTISSSFIRSLQRQRLQASPFPKASDDISLVNVVQDTAHLGPMVTNAFSACTAVQVAAGAGTFSGLELSAPSNRTLKIYYLDNLSPENFRCGLAPVGTFTTVGLSPCMEWGDEDIQGTLRAGHRNTTLTVRFIEFPTISRAAFTPVFVAPGEIFSLQQTTANVDFAANIAWEEFG